jgi:hypothetical protein
MMALFWGVSAVLGLARFLRIPLFWCLVLAVVAASAFAFPPLDLQLVSKTVGEAFAGNIEHVSRREFAFALASLLAALAGGLAIAFYLLLVLPVQLTLRRARALVARAQGKKGTLADVRRAFAMAFPSVRERLGRNWLLGHAWFEFDETLFDTDSDRAIGSTVRPQAFFHLGLARERLGGLKMMNAVPGYFVGLGLLLTFVGLVFALYKAGAAATAGDADVMAAEMGELLQIATFKFSTSIAGLGASLVLSIFFRWYFVLIEAAFDRFDAALERGLLYAAPQAISMTISRTLEEQLVQLKDITQGEFFARMGTELAPRMNSAIAEAMAPITEHIGNAVGSLTTGSERGIQDMLAKFVDSLQHGAGTEMRELAATLKQFQMSIVEMQGGLRGSGSDFSEKLSEAADNLNRMVERAGRSFEESSGQSRDALVAVVTSLTETLERANGEMDKKLGAAANGASEKLEAAMGLVLGKLDGQIGQIGQSVGDFQGAMGEQAEALTLRLRAELDMALEGAKKQFAELATSMRAIEGALTSQKVALEAASGEVRRTSEAFGESARSVQMASAPLLTVGERFTGATSRLATSVDNSLATLTSAKEEMERLAAGLATTNEQAGAFWTSFTAKFEAVDTALAQSVGKLSEATVQQQQLLTDHVRKVDEGLATAVTKLSPLLIELSESAGMLADSVHLVRPREPAE